MASEPRLDTVKTALQQGARAECRFGKVVQTFFCDGGKFKRQVSEGAELKTYEARDDELMEAIRAFPDAFTRLA